MEGEFAARSHEGEGPVGEPAPGTWRANTQFGSTRASLGMTRVLHASAEMMGTCPKNTVHSATTDSPIRNYKVLDPGLYMYGRSYGENYFARFFS